MGGAPVAEPIVGTRACDPRPSADVRMEHNPHFDALNALHRKQAEIREQIRVSQETVEGSQELLGRIDDMMAKSPLKP